MEDSTAVEGSHAEGRGASAAVPAQDAHADGTPAALRSKPSVLILNRSYWPDAEATGQLLTELCEDLAAEFDLTVVAGQPNQNPAGLPYKWWGAERHQGVTIRRVPHLTLGKRSIVGAA